MAKKSQLQKPEVKIKFYAEPQVMALVDQEVQQDRALWWPRIWGLARQVTVLNELVVGVQTAVELPADRRRTLRSLKVLHGKLYEEMARLDRVTAGYSNESLTSEIRDMVASLADGIRSYLGGDEEPLKSLVSELSPTWLSEIGGRIAELDDGGRPPGPTTWKQRLRVMWPHYELKNPGLKPYELRDKIRHSLSAQTVRTPVEEEILRRLSSSSWSNDKISRRVRELKVPGGQKVTVKGV